MVLDSDVTFFISKTFLKLKKKTALYSGYQ